MAPSRPSSRPSAPPTATSSRQSSARCSYLVDEVSPGRTPHAEVVVADGSVVDVLPPFAGGSGAAEQTGTRAALVHA